MNLYNRTDSGELSYAAPLYTPDNEEKQNYHVQNAFDEEKPHKQSTGYHEGTADAVQGAYTGSARKPSDNDSADISGVRRILGNMFPNAGKPNQGFTDTGAGVMAPVPIQEPEPQNQYKDVLDRALGGSFGEDLKQRFSARRQESKKRSEKAYRDAVSVMGGDPVFASYRAMEADDAVKDIEETIAETDVAELARRVAPLAKYDGYRVDEYLKERVLPKMYDTLLDEVLEDERPKNSAEYILRSSLTNSLIGKVALFARDKMLGNSNQTMLQSEGLGSYKANRLEQFAGNVGSLLVDAPVFSLLGGGSGIIMGKVANKVTSKLAGRILTRKFGEGMTREAAKNMAERVVAKRLGFKMLQSAGTQGLTLGNYDAMNSIVDDMLYQNDIDAGKAAGSFAKGTLTGAALGVVGTPLREASKGLTGAKKLLASSGVLSAESAVFTAGTELEKLKNDVEIAPIDLVKDFGESAATLLVMRMTHWRPKGASLKLGANGKIKEKFALSSSERAELKELNVNPEQFIDAIEKELKLPSFGGERSRYIKDTYSSIMSNEALSASARAKLLFLVENKVTSTPPVPFDFTVRQREDSKWEITTVDEVGRTVSRNIFDHAGNAKSYLMVKAADFRRNRIALFEAELTDGLRSANFIRQAGLYAKSSGKDIEEISTAVYKKSAGHEMSAEEKKIVDDILVRSAYDEAGMVQMLYNVRRKIEKRHGLEKGTMLIDIHKPFFHLTKAQNNSLDEYEALLRDEVDRLKGGTDKRRSVRLLRQGLDSDYFGMSNDEVKADEIQKYYDWVAVRDADRVGLHSEPHAPAPPRPIYIPPEDNSGYVWSYGEAKNTREDIERYKERAEAVAAKFGVKPHFIFDEREIERPDPEDYDAVARYNAQVVSSGWVNVGRVFINLPNAKNIEDVERTVLHEVVGHKGLMHVFGEHLNDFLEDVYRKASPEVLRGINRIKYQYRGFDNYTVMEEYLAYLAEGTGLTRQERSLYVRIKDYIRSLLIRMNIYTGSNRQISESELRDIMQRHCEYLQTKESPDDYRKDVFGSFNASYRDAKTYYDNALYRNELKSQIDKGEFLVSTPKFFRNAKELAHYDLLPPEQQKRVRERNGIVEEPAQNPVEENMYRRREKTTSGERSGVIPGNSSSGGLLQGSSGHLSRYSLATHEDVANIQREVPGSKYNVLKHFDENGEPLPEYYRSGDTKYRLPDDLTGKETRYRLPDDIYKGSGEEERHSLERDVLERGMAHDPEVGIPLLEDPFYRSLRANSPTYAYAYEHLRGLPPKDWKAYDHDLWNTLVGMAESGVERFVLKDIVTDKDFLMEHPELAMMPVGIEKDLPMPVMYDRKNNRILLDRRVYLYPQSRFYIDGALRSVARDFEERRNSVKRQLNEFNSNFKKSYSDAVTYARNLIKMREEIPGFDADNRIAGMYRSEFGFMPDEFMRRFPNMDDYLLYRVARSMGHFIGGRYNPEYRKEIDEAVDSKIKKYRSFFWGPVEIIIDAASGAEAEGPLRVATKKDYEERVAPQSGLDKADDKAYLRYEFPKLLHDISLFDPAIRSDPTGWEEYKRIRDAKIKAEKEKYGIKVPKTKEEKKRELELEKKRLKMN